MAAGTHHHIDRPLHRPDDGTRHDDPDLHRDEEGQPDDRPNRPPTRFFLIAGGILVVLALAAFLYWLHARHFVSTDDAYTTAHVHEISSRINDTVTQVLVDDNQFVHTGDVLVRLDPRDFQVALNQAKANAGQSTAQLAQLQTSVGQAEANVTAAEAQIGQAQAEINSRTAALQKAQLDDARDTRLLAEKVIPKATYDATHATLLEAQASLKEGQAGLANAQAQAKGAQAALLEAQSQVKVGQANLEASQANVDAAALQLSYCEIRAPVDGKVSKKTVEEGQRLTPGEALMAIVPQHVWILANYKETQLGRIRAGQRVDIRIDILPHHIFYGTVDSIQEGTGATFSLLPPDNATGNFTKIVQRIPVKIVFDEASIRDFTDRIVPGLSCIPRIDLDSLTDHSREPQRQKRITRQNREEEQARAAAPAAAP